MDLTASTPTAVVATIDTCLMNPSAAALTPVGSLCFHVYFPHPITLVPTLVATLGSDHHSSSLPVTRTDDSDPFCSKYATHGMNYMVLTGHIESSDPETTSALISQYEANIVCYTRAAIACFTTGLTLIVAFWIVF